MKAHFAPLMLVLVLSAADPLVATGQTPSPNYSRAVSPTSITPMVSWLEQEVATEYNISTISGVDLSHFTPRDWDEFRLSERRRLRSTNADERARALQNIVYAAIYYADVARLKRSTMMLYEVYRFDDNERNRIMALVALRAIGSEASMRNLAAHSRLEQSEKVRTLTLAAVRDYYASQSK